MRTSPPPVPSHAVTTTRTAAEPCPDADVGNTAAGYLVTLVELTVALLAVSLVAVGGTALLVVWESVAMIYLAVGAVAIRARSLREPEERRRVGALDTLSWLLPLIAGATGVYCAMVVVGQADTAGPLIDRALVGVCGSIGIFVSWALLHTGFAQAYQAAHTRRPLDPPLSFPGTTTPGTLDFFYFSFTIATSFATSDTTVRTPRARWVVMVHSVVSFMFNALVVAVAYQVLQLLARAS